MNPDPKLSYRSGTLNDLEALQRLALESYGVFKTVLTPDNWKIMENNMKRKELFSELIEKAETFVAEYDGEIIGMVFLTPSGFKHPLYEKDWSVIRFLGVHPNHNGKGIAKYLTEKCIEAAKKNKEKIIGLHTSPVIMSNAIRIYLKCGFKFYKDIDNIFGVPYQLYKMELH